MSKATNILSKIRLAFADVKVIMTNIPKFIGDIKKDQEKKILKQRLHQMTDAVCETYGDLALSIAKNLDINLIQNIVEDVILLAAKYEEPLKNQGKLLATELQKVVEKQNEKQGKILNAFTKVIMRIAKRNNWNSVTDNMPSELARKADYDERVAERQKKYDDARKAEKEKRENIHRTVRSFYTEKLYRMERAIPESEFNKAKYEAHLSAMVDKMMDY